jgi:hypothetical protein
MFERFWAGNGLIIHFIDIFTIKVLTLLPGRSVMYENGKLSPAEQALRLEQQRREADENYLNRQWERTQAWLKEQGRDPCFPNGVRIPRP